MRKTAWQIEHSVEVDASPDFAWSFWTDVNNWVDPPARFALDGPFANGAKGTTVLPEQEPLRWQLRDVVPGESYVVETTLDQATLSFEWSFEPVAEVRTKLTQRIVLSGDAAEHHVDAVANGFGSTLAAGMERIAVSISAAHAAADAH